MGNYCPPNLKDTSPGKGKRLDGKQRGVQGSGIKTTLEPSKSGFTSSMPYAGTGRKEFTSKARMTRGNTNDTNGKVKEFYAYKDGLRANAKAVADMYNGKPMNLSMNRAQTVKKGKIAPHEHNRYDDRKIGTM